MNIPKGGESSNSNLWQSTPDQSVFGEFESYPFNNDPEFRVSEFYELIASTGHLIHSGWTSYSYFCNQRQKAPAFKHRRDAI